MSDDGRNWQARHDDLEEELQQASMVIVELEDELEQKNRTLADHERHISKMVTELPPTPAGMKQRDGAPSRFRDVDAGDFSAPGLPIGGLLAGAASPDGAAAALQRENERLKAEIRALLEEGHAQAHLVAESDAGSVSSDGSFGTAAVPTHGDGGAGHMRAQLEHYQSDVIRLEQKVRALRNEATFKDNVIVALREEGGGGADGTAAEMDALRDFADASALRAEERGSKVDELMQQLAAARELQRSVESDAVLTAELTEARDQGLSAKLAAVEKDLADLKRSVEAAAAAEDVDATPDAPADPTEPYEALIASLQQRNKTLEAQLTEVKSGVSEAADALQGSLSESWGREEKSEAALRECDTELADLRASIATLTSQLLEAKEDTRQPEEKGLAVAAAGE